MTTYKWTTARGANVELAVDVKHITTETINADGFDMDVKCDKWQRSVSKCLVNGKATALKELCYERGMCCVLIGRQGRDRILVALPKDVEEAIYGEERKAAKEKEARRAEVEKSYQAHREMMRKAMDN